MPGNAFPYTGTGLVRVDPDGNLILIDPVTALAVAKYVQASGKWSFPGTVTFAGPSPYFDVTNPAFAGGAKGDGVTDAPSAASLRSTSPATAAMRPAPTSSNSGASSKSTRPAI